MIEQLEQKAVIKSNKKENKKNLNLSKRIDNVLKNINERNPVRLRDYTPQVLVENGVKDLPMYENPSHIRKNILTKEEAQKFMNKKELKYGYKQPQLSSFVLIIYHKIILL